MPTVYLIPSVLAENALETIPAYILDAIMDSRVIYAENERTARRFLKSLDKNISIDDFECVTIHKSESEVTGQFRKHIHEGKNISIISEAGCPGIADPGQALIAVAQELNCIIRPLVGPSSILLALMASGMNGQHFAFHGYLPIDTGERTRKIKMIESDSQKNNSTHLFIETPYRNNQLIESILKTCDGKTRLCVAVNITGADESIITLSIAQWRKKVPDLHKKPALFLIQAG